MIVDQNLEIPDLLVHAESTNELYASLILYTPSQHCSAYDWSRFAPHFLTVVRNMVSLTLYIHAPMSSV